MTTSSITRAISASIALAAASLALMAPAQVQAREGAQSVGKGIKCYYTYTTNPTTGVVTGKQVCYKSV